MGNVSSKFRKLQVENWNVISNINRYYMIIAVSVNVSFMKRQNGNMSWLLNGNAYGPISLIAAQYYFVNSPVWYL